MLSLWRGTRFWQAGCNRSERGFPLTGWLPGQFVAVSAFGGFGKRKEVNREFGNIASTEIYWGSCLLPHISGADDGCELVSLNKNSCLLIGMFQRPAWA